MKVGSDDWYRDCDRLHYLRGLELKRAEALEREAQVHRHRARLLNDAIEAIGRVRREGLKP